jgi:hypothetical protein
MCHHMRGASELAPCSSYQVGKNGGSEEIHGLICLYVECLPAISNVPCTAACGV